MAEKRDYYEILEVTKTATVEEIKKAASEGLADLAVAVHSNAGIAAVTFV